MKNHFSRSAISSLLVLAALMCAGLGCNLAEKLNAAKESGPGADRRSTGPARSTDSKVIMYESAEAIEDFTAKLKETLGTDDPNVLNLLVYDQYITIKVQDPKKPENIDGYTYRDGELGPPAPVKLIGNGKIEDNVFRLSEVNLAALPKLTQEVRAKLAEIEGGSMVGYSIGRGLPFKKDISMDPLVNSSRKSISADADRNGKLTKWEVE